MYSVTLVNKDCIFDRGTGFETIEDCERWASGRGGRYHIMIEDMDAPINTDPIVKDYWIRFGRIVEGGL